MSAGRWCTGVESLALGAVSAGVQVVTGYPGSPATRLWEAVVRFADEGQAGHRPTHAEWSVNEKVAFETAFGASAAGLNSLVVIKGVGFNVLVDAVMTANLSGVRGGLVLAVGDDPGAAWSQNEQDTRPLAAACQLPVLEPVSARLGSRTMVDAFTLSRRLALPVVVRFTGLFAESQGPLPEAPAEGGALLHANADFPTDGRLRSTARRAVHLHQQLYRKLADAAQLADESPLNDHQSPGAAARVAVAAGYGAALLAQVTQELPQPGPVASLTTTFPLPAHRLAEFVASADEVLVVEEGGSFVEGQLRALLQKTGRATRVLGKDTEHLPPVGQLTREQIAAALSAKAGPLPPSEPDRSGHAGFCGGCPFVPVFQMLGEMTSEVTEDRSRPLFIADPGCAVYADLPPFELLEVKQVLGSSTAIGIGLARALPHRRVVAFTGDGSFFHSGVQGLIDAASQRTPLGVIILDNASAAMTGFQPTPIAVATQKRAILRPDLVTLARACGARRVTRVDATNHATLRRRLKQLLFSRRLEVLIVRGKCPDQ